LHGISSRAMPSIPRGAVFFVDDIEFDICRTLETIAEPFRPRFIRVSYEARPE